MNAVPSLSEAESHRERQNQMESPSARLHSALHDMAQPLTALSFLLELARMQSGPEGMHSALNDAVAECQRTFRAMEEVRAAAHAWDGKGEWQQ